MMRDDYSFAELLTLRKGLTDTQQQLWPFLILLNLQISLDSDPSFSDPRPVAPRTVTPALLLGLLCHTSTPPGFTAYGSTSPRKLLPGTATFFLIGSLPGEPPSLTGIGWSQPSQHWAPCSDPVMGQRVEGNIESRPQTIVHA